MSNKIKFILIASFLIPFCSYANTYYFSDSVGDDSRTPMQAQHPNSPWKSLAKLNSFFYRLNPGDTVLFKRGEIFQGVLRIAANGNNNHPIVFSAYGNGARPQISGLKMLSNWQPEKKGVWSSVCANCSGSLNVVLVNDSMMPMGRYPNASASNAGYRTIADHFKNSSITDSAEMSSTDWAGAELVIRKNRFIIDRSRIIQTQGNTISYRGGSFYEPTNGFGYFIQDHPATLDQNGEWFFEKTTKKLVIYFYPGNPVSMRIKVSTQDTLLKCEKAQWLVFDNLSFSGANSVAIFINNSQHVSLTHCDIRYSGTNAITVNESNNITIDGNNIQDSYNNAVELNGSENSIANNKILNSGTIAGMGENENSYNAINIKGDQNVVAGNEIENTGYSSIFFLGNNISVSNNFINRFTMVKDDGGGIYTWSGKSKSDDLQTGRSIDGNFVMNGMNALGGTNRMPAIVAGIYLDDNTGNVAVFDNTVSGCGIGLYLHNAHDNSVDRNTLVNNDIQFYVKEDQAKFEMTNNLVRQNFFVSTTETQKLVQFFTTNRPVNQCADLDSNQYISPKTGKSAFVTFSRKGKSSFTDYGMENWKSAFGFDKHSIMSDCATAKVEMNSTNREKQISLNGSYFDSRNKSYKGEMVLPAFRSIVLFTKKPE